MNILYVVNDLAYFRAHRESLARNMSAAGHRVTVASGEYDGQTPENWDTDIELFALPLDRHRLSLIKDMQMIWRVKQLIKKTNADIVHCYTIKPILYGGIACWISRNRKLKLIWTFAGLGKIFEESYSISHRLRQKLVVMALKSLAQNNTSRASFENTADRDNLVRRQIIPSKSTKVLMGAGIELQHYCPAPAGLLATNECIKFVMASRLIKGKGVDMFLQVAHHHNQNSSPCRFILAGIWDTANHDSLDKDQINEAVRNGDIEFVGSVSQSNMPELLQTCDVFCLPTQLQEGFPRSLLEAAACGLAMISSDQVPMRTLIKPAQTGWLIKDASADGFHDAVNDALSNIPTTKEYGLQARRLIENLPVDTKSITQGFLRLYE